MTAQRIHLVRHGEVENPEGILYERLPGFGLSARGRRMAERTARSLVDRGARVTRLYASPLQRAQESAQPIAERYELPIITDPRLVEAGNRFRGRRVAGPRGVVSQPSTWRWMYNPLEPSWGEPYKDIAARMLAAMEDAWRATDGGDVVLVSHELPIWMVHRAILGESLPHDPRRRRCALSSVTTFERDIDRDRFVEVDYQDPNRDARLADEGNE